MELLLEEDNIAFCEDIFFFNREHREMFFETPITQLIFSKPQPCWHSHRIARGWKTVKDFLQDIKMPNDIYKLQGIGIFKAEDIFNALARLGVSHMNNYEEYPTFGRYHNLKHRPRINASTRWYIKLEEEYYLSERGKMPHLISRNHSGFFGCIMTKEVINLIRYIQNVIINHKGKINFKKMDWNDEQSLTHWEALKYIRLDKDNFKIRITNRKFWNMINETLYYAYVHISN